MKRKSLIIAAWVYTALSIALIAPALVLAYGLVFGYSYSPDQWFVAGLMGLFGTITVVAAASTWNEL